MEYYIIINKPSATPTRRKHDDAKGVTSSGAAHGWSPTCQVPLAQLSNGVQTKGEMKSELSSRKVVGKKSELSCREVVDYKIRAKWMRNGRLISGSKMDAKWSTNKLDLNSREMVDQ